MSDVIVELRRERAALSDRLAKINAAIEDYERWAESAAALVGPGKTPTSENPRVDANGEQTPIVEFEEQVRALFDRIDRPLKRAEVFEQLARAGVVVGGKDPLNTVAARLSRMDGITNIKGLGYWAEDRSRADWDRQNHLTPDDVLFDTGEAPRPENASRTEGDETGPDEA